MITPTSPQPVTRSRAFTDMVDLASERLGTAVIAANDEFFAPKENLIKATKPIWNEEYTERGKWMDGWETRRRREAGYDWCILRLGIPGIIHGIVVDTAFFRGNYPEHCSLDGCDAPDATIQELTESKSVKWRPLLGKSALKGDSENPFPIQESGKVTHIRLNIFPDGGVARLRVYGLTAQKLDLADRGDFDLAALENGGYVVSCSDMFFGNRHHLIMPGPSRQMNEGWETKRRRGKGNDWAIVRLTTPGTISRAEVDTSYFKGNAPGSCSLDAIVAPTDDPREPPPEDAKWRPLLSRTILTPHSRHFYEDELRDINGVTHVRLNIYPDGGVARLRLWGSPASSTRAK